MILSSNSPVRRSGTPSQFLGVLLHTTAMFGLSRVRTESVYLLVVPFLAHRSEQLNGQLANHRDLGNLPLAPHGQVNILTTPFRKAAHRHLCRRKRSSVLPCLLMCPSRRRSPLDSSDGTSPR
jgi:hypothetical protein